MFAELDECHTRCEYPCDTTTMAYATSIDEVPIYVNTPEHVFIVENYAHLEIKEDYKMDRDEYMTALGGDLNLWIGGSLLAVFHLIVYPLRVLLLVGKKRNRRVSRMAIVSWARSTRRKPPTFESSPSGADLKNGEAKSRARSGSV